MKRIGVNEDKMEKKEGGAHHIRGESSPALKSVLKIRAGKTKKKGTLGRWNKQFLATSGRKNNNRRRRLLAGRHCRC